MKQKYCQSQNSLPIKFFCEINCLKVVVFLLTFDSRMPSHFAPLVVRKCSKICKVEQGEIWQGLGEALESVLVCDERQEMLPIEGLQQRSSMMAMMQIYQICLLSSLQVASGISLIQSSLHQGVIFRPINNLLFHEDSQFPNWNIGE